MEHKVYMHSINHQYFNSKRDIKTFSYILDDGALLSLRRQGFNYSSSFAGLDYISFADYEKRNQTNNGILYYNAYYAYIRLGISLAFEKNKLASVYDIKEPIILEALNNSDKIHYRMQMLGYEEERYTDLPDEVQIKDEVSIDYLSYITYPCDEFFVSRFFIKQESKRKGLIEEINNLKSIIISHGKQLDIYDIDSGILLDEEGIEKVLEKYKKC